MNSSQQALKYSAPWAGPGFLIAVGGGENGEPGISVVSSPGGASSFDNFPVRESSTLDRHQNRETAKPNMYSIPAYGHLQLAICIKF